MMNHVMTNHKVHSERDHGIELLRNRFTNKGTAFTLEEREKFGLRGILPPQVETLDDQAERVWLQLKRFEKPIEWYQHLRTIQDTNNVLFYKVVMSHLLEILPIIYTPTVGEACQKFAELFQHDHGVYVCSADKGHVKEVLMNKHRCDVDLMVITDGSRILGLGDLGANGMGIPIGKCSLYVAGAGIDPRRILSVMLDVGTNRESLRNDPSYLGQRIPRISDDEYYPLMQEFLDAVKDLWPRATVQFEDFSNNHCFDLLERFRDKYRCFNDDIQGTGAVIAAGFYNALTLSGIPAQDQRILVFGAGGAAAGVTHAISQLISTKTNIPAATILKNVYMVDTQGLVTTTRGDQLAAHKVPFARTDIAAEDNVKYQALEDIVRAVRPTALIGLSASGPAFTQSIIEFVCTYAKRPIIFPLSNPTSKSEITAQDAYTWTKGAAIFASGSPYPHVAVGGRLLEPSQGNNMYIFPGIGLGCVIAQPTRITDSVMVRAASSLADMMTESDIQRSGMLYPPLTMIRKISAHVAAGVIAQCQLEGLGGEKLPKTIPELMKLCEACMWQPVYPAALPENPFCDD